MNTKSALNTEVEAAKKALEIIKGREQHIRDQEQPLSKEDRFLAAALAAGANHLSTQILVMGHLTKD